MIIKKSANVFCGDDGSWLVKDTWKRTFVKRAQWQRQDGKSVRRARERERKRVRDRDVIYITRLSSLHSMLEGEGATNVSAHAIYTINIQHAA